MKTPETINIEKYADALNNLVGMDIGYLGDSDENVNAIVEVIVVAKALENRVKELEGSLKMSEYLRKTAYERIEQLDKLCGDLQKFKRDIFDDIEKVFEPSVSALFLTSETLVDVSKLHIDVDRAIIDIRKYLNKAICSRYQLKKTLEELSNKYIGENDNE